MMHVLIAPDKFKGSLTAREVCDHLAEGFWKADPSLNIEPFPLADGGEGSLHVIQQYLQAQRFEVRSVDPLGRPINGYYLKKDRKVFIELATCSGLELLSPDERNPLISSSRGTGIVLKEAIKSDVEEVYLFIGGSATNDAAMGILDALGFRFLDRTGSILRPKGESLAWVVDIIPPKPNPYLKVRFQILCDVKNPLYGKDGAAQVYAPQKGADSKMVDTLDRGLKHFARAIERFNGMIVDDVSGGGAAVGIGAGLLGLLKANLVSGIQTIIELTQFEQSLLKADWVVTGEGKLDAQSLSGKVVSGVAQHALMNHIPCGIVCGTNLLSKEEQAPLGARFLKSILDRTPDHQRAMKEAGVYLQQIGYEIASEYFK